MTERFRHAGISMKLTSPTQKPKPYALGLLLLAAILVVLFWKSFVPGYVEFSNDSPLGIQMANWIQLPQGFTGMWGDLNDIGGYAAAFPPDVTALVRWSLGAVGYAKFSQAIAIFILGAGAWLFFRQLRLSPLAVILGTLAAALNSTLFSDACWGVPSHQIAFGMDYLALALVVSGLPQERSYRQWLRLALAGLAVGINVMEAFDIGAIFSIFIAAFVLFHSLMEAGSGSAAKRFATGIVRIAVVAIFAGFIAAQTISTLVSSQIKGIAGTGQSEKAKVAHWNEATEWSLPKIETLGIIVPGLFGYRMDTPNGGSYWGAVGRHPSWDRYFANGEKGQSGQGPLRFTGTGNYAGVLVLLVALWAITESFRRKTSVFSDVHRKFLWFWTAILIVTLLFSFGRFAPFYALLYKLPYFSTIRNPVKFLFVFSWALATVFAYGVHALSRRYLEIPAASTASPLRQFKTWWKKARGFDHNWVSVGLVVLVASLFAWVAYAVEKPKLVAYLEAAGFPNESSAKGVAEAIATFSIWQVGWFILFFVLALGLLALIWSGALAGRRAKWGGILLGILLVLDLGRADLPWIVYWNYPQKYATNPIINILKNKPYEHRVAVLHSKSPFENLYTIEWAQQLFTYYNIQSLDKVQLPRQPVDLEAYEAVVTSDMARHWELTNTRYLLGPAGYLNALNAQLDPVQHRFRIVQRFSLAPKPGVENPTQYSEITAVPDENGDYALFEFTGALPRAKLYSDWQIPSGNPIELNQWVKTMQKQLPEEMGNALASQGDSDLATLQTLISTNFNPWQTVLVSTNPQPPVAASATNANPGTVEYKSYTSKDIVLAAHAKTPSVLLLNDKFDPNWHVFVDGEPRPLLRCNFIMRGVYLKPGDHTVEFKFAPPIDPLYVSLSAIGVGILLSGFLFVSRRRT